MSFFTSIPSIFGHLDDIFHDVSVGIFKKATEVNFWKNDRQDYLSFQASFYGGYVTGYVAEQVILLKGIGSALSAFKVGAKVGQISHKGVELLTKITEKVSGKAANILRKAEIWTRVGGWTDDTAKLGAARISGYLDDVEKANVFFKRVDDIADIGGAERVSRSINRIAETSDTIAKSMTENLYHTATKSNTRNLVGSLAEIEVAAKYADELHDVQRIIKHVGDDVTDFDIVLKNGDVIEVRYWNWANNPDAAMKISKKISKLKRAKGLINMGEVNYATKINKIKFAFKEAPPADVSKVLSENGIPWELI